jgi:hypothetical protein
MGRTYYFRESVISYNYPDLGHQNTGPFCFEIKSLPIRKINNSPNCATPNTFFSVCNRVQFYHLAVGVNIWSNRICGSWFHYLLSVVFGCCLEFIGFPRCLLTWSLLSRAHFLPNLISVYELKLPKILQLLKYHGLDIWSIEFRNFVVTFIGALLLLLTCFLERFGLGRWTKLGSRMTIVKWPLALIVCSF